MNATNENELPTKSNGVVAYGESKITALYRLDDSLLSCAMKYPHSTLLSYFAMFIISISAINVYHLVRGVDILVCYSCSPCDKTVFLKYVAVNIDGHLLT